VSQWYCISSITKLLSQKMVNKKHLDQQVIPNHAASEKKMKSLESRTISPMRSSTLLFLLSLLLLSFFVFVIHSRSDAVIDYILGKSS
jgi:hypothetical protein